MVNLTSMFGSVTCSSSISICRKAKRYETALSANVMRNELGILFPVVSFHEAARKVCVTRRFFSANAPFFVYLTNRHFPCSISYLTYYSSVTFWVAYARAYWILTASNNSSIIQTAKEAVQADIIFRQIRRHHSVSRLLRLNSRTE